jgi:hypothetical protein
MLTSLELIVRRLRTGPANPLLERRQFGRHTREKLVVVMARR